MSTIKQFSFAGGEISPSLQSRCDLSKYMYGLATERNFWTPKDGGAENRPGTIYTGDTLGDQPARLIPFFKSKTESYQIELTNLKLRVLKNGAFVLRDDFGPFDITDITVANPGVFTYAFVADDLSDGENISFSGIQGMDELNGGVYVVANVDTVGKTFEITDQLGNPIDTSTFDAYVSGGVASVLYMSDSPYATADLPYLDFSQSVDTMVFTHPNYEVQNLTRSGDEFGFSAAVFNPNFPGPSPVVLTTGGAAGATVYEYAVTEVFTGSVESSPTITTIATGNATISPSNYINVSVDIGIPTPVERTFNVYRTIFGSWGLVGVFKTAAGVGGVVASAYRDVGVNPDTTNGLITFLDVFDAAGGYPAAVTHMQQRLFLARPDDDPETVYASQTANYYRFFKRSPGDVIRDSDSIEFNLAGKFINPVRYIIDLGGLVLFTESAEFYCEGATGGIITPGEINPKAQSYNGIKWGLQPLIINDTALYVQDIGSVVRELGYVFESDGYRGDDLTTFAYHMLKNKQIVSWAYQKLPNSMVWMVLNDGTVAALTHIKEQQILAWHRHDFSGGLAKTVSVARETDRDAVYFTIQRGDRYVIEKLDTRVIDDIVDAKFMDSSVSYDGRTIGFLGLKMDDPTDTWTYDTPMELIATGSYFDDSFVGKEIHFVGPEGDKIRFAITSVVDPNNAIGTPNATVPVSMRDVSMTNWSLAIKELKGLFHLEGEMVSVFADAYVVCSPNNSQVAFQCTVENGRITLDKCYSVIHVGLPITADIKTLSVDTAQGETLMDKMKLINKVAMQVDESRGGFYGTVLPTGDDAIEGLYEIKVRNHEAYNDPTELKTGMMDVVIEANWEYNGQVVARQVDPLPLKFSSIAPVGTVPFSR